MIMARKRRKKSKNYFTQETEDYIVVYNGLDPDKDEKKRSEIYAEHIHYPFFKLTQNIIHTFKFYHTEVENLEHLQHEIINKGDVGELLKESSTYTYNIGDGAIKSDLDKYVDLYVDYVTENIYELFPKKNDAQIADAILELFRKREDLEVFNKKALYIYIREMVEVKTPKITKIADKLHHIFKSSYTFYLENGYTRF